MRKYLLLAFGAVLFTAASIFPAYAAIYDTGRSGNSWDDAYIIASSEDMTLMKTTADEGKYYKLDADISLTNWQAIGSFTGHFDGQNHTITINGSQGLFDTITVSDDEIAVRNLIITGTVRDYGSILASRLESGVIDNCRVEGGTLSGTSYYMGGLIRVMSGGTVRNCSVKADIRSRNYDAGGIVGQMLSGNITGCTLAAGSTVSAVYNTGGIVGYMEGGSLKSCTVSEGVSVTASNDAGGIAGVSGSGTLIEGCSVKAGASITASGKAGGIVGDLSRSTVKGCTVSENTSITGGDAGGIAGQSDRGTIEGCTVSQGIKVTGSAGGAGGIVPYMTGSTVRNCIISDSVNVSSSGASGGIVGEASGESVIDSCDVGASLNVKSSGHSGGIAGLISGGTFKDCTVGSGMSAEGNYVGGIAGTVRSVDVEGCSLSSGTSITGSNSAGGIVGSISAGNVIACGIAENISITSAGDAGGIAGNMQNGDIDGCTFGANLVLNASNNGGGVAGNLTEGTVKNCSIGSGTRITASRNAGGITGVTGSGATIESCDVKSGLNIKASENAGGITGNMTAGSITGCTVSEGANVTSSGDVGGIAGNMGGGNINNCGVGANVVLNASQNAGGITGNMTAGSITGCTLSEGANVTSSGETGGIVGNMSNGTIDSCTVKAGATLRASNNAGGTVGNALAGTIRNCTVEDGTRIFASRRIGGIVGNSESGVVLDGNKWPARYSDIGQDNPQISWNGHRYQAFNENMTWEEAKSRCESLGGHLATITSSLEQEQVENLLSQSQTQYPAYWIGARTNTGGFLEWVTDEVLERQYDNFADGQPDGSGNYIHLIWDEGNDAGKWDDTKLEDEERGYICEWDDDPPAIEEADTASDFQRWQQDPEAWSNPDSTVPSGARPSPVDTSHLSDNPPNVERSDLPVSYDARQSGILPPVRNQGVYETCWAFATLGAMETNYLMHQSSDNPVSIDLSELHLAWFAYKDPSSDSFGTNIRQNILLEGGDPNIATSFLIKTNIAPVNEEDMPYESAGNVAGRANSMIQSFLNGRTAGSFRRARITLMHVNDIQDIKRDYENDAETVNNIKQNILEHGAVYFRYINSLQGYNSDFTTFYSTNANDGQHAALIVGWDDNYPAENFKNNPGKPGAWLVRTSQWVDKFTNESLDVGDDDYGCFWMSYAQAATDGGIAELRSFIVSEDRNELRENGTSIHTKDITSAWAARIFRATRNERLIRISFHTTDNNMKYQLYVSKFGKKVPTDPGHAEDILSSGDIAFAGYHTIVLPEALTLYEGDYYSVILKMTSFQTSNYRFPTAVEASIDKYIAVSVAEGESFFAEGDEVPSLWQDGKNVEGGPYNACIMTFSEAWTTNDTAPTITTTALSQATVGEPYSFKLSSSGTQTIEWRSGNIPEDFTLSREGELSGNPQTPGQHEIFFTAMNDVGYEEKTFTLTVKAAEIPPQDDEDKHTQSESEDIPPHRDSEDIPPKPDSEDIPLQSEDVSVTPVSSSNSGCDSGAGIIAGMIILALAVRKVRGK